MNNILTTAIALLFSLALGGFLIWFGEQDDSPGAQFLGLMTVVGGLVYVWKHRRSDE